MAGLHTFRLSASRGVTPRRTGGSLYFADAVSGSWRHAFTELQYLSTAATYRREITDAGLAEFADSADDLIEAFSWQLNYGLGIVTSHQGKFAPLGSVGQVLIVLGLEAGTVSSSSQNQSRTTLSASALMPF